MCRLSPTCEHPLHRTTSSGLIAMHYRRRGPRKPQKRRLFPVSEGPGNASVASPHRIPTRQPATAARRSAAASAAYRPITREPAAGLAPSIGLFPRGQRHQSPCYRKVASTPPPSPAPQGTGPRNEHDQQYQPHHQE